MSLTAPLRLRVEKPKIRLRVLPKLIPLDGKSVEMQTTADYIQWRLVGDTAWTNLIALADIDGSDGEAATISVGTVTTLDAGSDATVANSGTSNEAIFDFGIPKGADGTGDMVAATYDPQGIAGDAFARANHTGTQSADTITDGTTNKAYTATEKAKLTGIETGADVTDAANVAAAGAVMSVATDASTFGFVLDEDDMASDSATKLPTQQSVRARIERAESRFATISDAEAYAPVAAPDYIRTAGYSAAGDGGGALYKKDASEPSHNGKFSITLADGATVVWYELAEKIVRPQMFGAAADGTTDDTAAIQSAFDIGRPVELVGQFALTEQIAVTGSIETFGYGRVRSMLTWGASATSVGLKASITDEHDYASIKDIAFRTAGTSGTAIDLDFTGQAGSTFNIEPRCEIIGCDIRGSTDETVDYFDVGILLTQVLNARVLGNYILGGYSGAGTITDLSASYGVKVIDGGFDNTVSLFFKNNTVMFFSFGLYGENFEGVWATDNDFQVCTNGVYFINNDRRKNQLRLTGNHLSCTATHVSVNWYRFVKLIGNEISARNEVTGSAKALVAIRDTADVIVQANTFRKNATTDSVTGLFLDQSVQSLDCERIIVAGNEFYALDVGTDPNSSTDIVIGNDNLFIDTPVRGGFQDWQTLAQSSVAVAHTGDTTETTLAEIVVPAGRMGPNGRVRVTTLWSCTNNANVKTAFVRWGGTGVNGNTIGNLILTSLAGTRDQREISNRNSAASQIAAANSLVNTGGFGATTTPLTATTKNTGVDNSIYLNAKLNTSTDTVTLESYRVEVLYQE